MDYDSQEVSVESELLPLWFTQMQLTDTFLEIEDIEMESDQNFSAEIPVAIESYTINQKPLPNIELLLRQPNKFRKRGISYAEEIEKITGNAQDALNPTRQSTPNSSPNSTPKVDPHQNELIARRLF